MDERCSNCGEPVAAGNNFCESCGSPLIKAETVPPVPPPPPADAVEGPQPFRFDPYTGAPLTVPGPGEPDDAPMRQPDSPEPPASDELSAAAGAAIPPAPSETPTSTQPGQPSPPGDIKKLRPRWLLPVIAAAVAGGVAITTVAALSFSGGHPAAAGSPSANRTQTCFADPFVVTCPEGIYGSPSFLPVSPTPPLPPAPDPKASYTHSCTADFGDQNNGFRTSFIGNARIHNTGNVGIIVTVAGSWPLVARTIRVQKSGIRIPTGGFQEVFLKTTGSQNDGGDWETNGFVCSVKATI